MKVETHQQLRASMLCIIAFTLGCIVVFCGGCAAANKTQTKVFDSQVEFGGGFFLQEAEANWEQSSSAPTDGTLTILAPVRHRQELPLGKTRCLQRLRPSQAL